MLARILQLGCLLFVLLASPAGASTLVINSNASDPAPRRAWARIIDDFRAENPDVEVQLNVFDHESYKAGIRSWLTSTPPDVVFWFAGARMRKFVELNLLADVSELYAQPASREIAPAAVDLVTVAGKQYGVPYAHYHIGFFYRADLLTDAGINKFPPDWAGLLETCNALQRVGIEPIAIGTRDLWPTGAWFDYINLRLNGFQFHMDLMNGNVPFTDKRVRNVMAKWRELLDRACFVRRHASVPWQESQTLMYQGKAAMMLIGNYVVAGFPSEVRDRMRFAAFPRINPTLGNYEDAPVNTLHVPAGARNQTDARRFLAFLLRADVQGRLNQATLTVPTNVNAALAEDRFIAAGRAHLARADALAQYFDRDMDEELAMIAMKGFQEFMIKPDRLESILENIELARLRIYGRR